MDWLRWWHGTTVDLKFKTIAMRANVPKVTVIGLWAIFLEYASQHEERGSLDGISFEDISISFDVCDALVTHVYEEMQNKGLITPDNMIANWVKRQTKRDDNSAERTRKYREKRKSQKPVTQCDATRRTVTLDKIREDKIRKDKEKIKQKRNVSDTTEPSEVSTETSALSESVDNPKKSFMIASIFAHWQTVHGKPRAKLDSKRKRLIDRSLGMGYSLDQLKQAIDGCSKSQFHSGLNETKTVYNDLGLILRDAAKIEMFMGYDDGTQISSVNIREREREEMIRSFAENEYGDVN